MPLRPTKMTCTPTSSTRVTYTPLHPAARAIAGASRPLLPYGAPSHAAAPHGNEHESHALALPGTSLAPGHVTALRSCGEPEQPPTSPYRGDLHDLETFKSDLRARETYKANLHTPESTSPPPPTAASNTPPPLTATSTTSSI